MSNPKITWKKEKVGRVYHLFAYNEKCKLLATIYRTHIRGRQYFKYEIRIKPYTYQDSYINEIDCINSCTHLLEEILAKSSPVSKEPKDEPDRKLSNLIEPTHRTDTSNLH